MSKRGVDVHKEGRTGLVQHDENEIDDRHASNYGWHCQYLLKLPPRIFEVISLWVRNY